MLTRESPLVDLAPHEWRSDRPQPHEPILGPGAPGFFAWLIGFAASTTAVYFILH